MGVEGEVEVGNGKDRIFLKNIYVNIGSIGIHIRYLLIEMVVYYFV